jgi:hypothetical protein
VIIGLEVEEKKQCALRRSERAIISTELVVVQMSGASSTTVTTLEKPWGMQDDRPNLGI